MKYPLDVDGMLPLIRIELVPYGVLGGDRKNAPCTIYLPLPTSGLVDNYTINFDSQAMGAIGGLASTAYQTFTNGASATDIMTAGFNAIGLQITRSLVGGLGDVVGMGKQAEAAVSLGTGMVLNPNYAILFEGIKPRTFNFTWMLTAENIEESREINRIVYWLKKYTLPKKNVNANANFVLNYPAIAYIGLFGPEQSDRDNNRSVFMSFATGGTFVTGLNINFNGGAATPAFFKNIHSPVQVQLSLSFMERNILTSDDILFTEV